MICVGERLQSGSRVSRSCTMAGKKRLLSKLPVGPVLDISRSLAVFTATSPRPLD